MEVTVIMTDTKTTPRYLGIDAGGTQTSVHGNTFLEVLRLGTKQYASLQELILQLLHTTGIPEVMVIGAAGAIEPNGSVQLTNCKQWPSFDPIAFGESIGCEIRVVNDMAIKAAGLVNATVDVIHMGRAEHYGRRTVVTVSTGVNYAVLMPENGGSIFTTEGGHLTWQPADELEEIVLREIRKKLGQRYVSVEQLIGGSHLLNLYDALNSQDVYYLGDKQVMPSNRVRHQVYDARQHGEGIGPIITSHALTNEPFCELFMSVMASVLGQYLRNVALTTMPRGGIYLTGGVMQPEVAHELLTYTSFFEAYTGGSEHNGWLQDIPMHLVTDRDLGVKGALQLARQD
jgi:glucokinase